MYMSRKRITDAHTRDSHLRSLKQRVTRNAGTVVGVVSLLFLASCSSNAKPVTPPEPAVRPESSTAGDRARDPAETARQMGLTLRSTATLARTTATPMAEARVNTTTAARPTEEAVLPRRAARARVVSCPMGAAGSCRAAIAPAIRFATRVRTPAATRGPMRRLRRAMRHADQRLRAIARLR